MDYKLISDHIVKWISDDIKESHAEGCVVGVSGGIDSAVVSTLCAMTGLPLICVQMPINSNSALGADKHIQWLEERYPENVKESFIRLSKAFRAFQSDIPAEYQTELAMVNLSSRIRMATLYTIANSKNYLVVGTGNKVEDRGIGFFTKYGDGGVDISPIGELLKSEVYGMAKYLELIQEVQKSIPNDGLWEDGRTDEDQIGANYPDLEWVMDLCNRLGGMGTMAAYKKMKHMLLLNDEKKKILEIYLERHEKSAHKMAMPRICSLDAVR